MSGRNGIIRPDAVNVETTFADGPLAQPCAVTLQNAGSLKLLAVGGLTKVEALAGQIAAGVYSQAFEERGKWDELKRWTAETAVDLAEDILAECARRRKPTTGGDQ